jgi:CHAT domain-containing protein
MSRTVRRSLLVLAVAVLTAIAVPHAQGVQAPKVDPQLVRQFAEASTDDARAALLAASPILGEQDGRTALSNLGAQLVTARQFAAAEQAFLTLQWLGAQNKSVRTRSAALIGFGNLEGQRGNLLRSLQLTEQALAMLEEANDLESTVSPLSNLAIVHRRMGNYDQAAELSARGVAILKAQPPSEAQKASLSRFYNNIGVAHFAQGNLVRAREYLELSLSLKKDDGGRGTSDMGTTVTNLGSVYSALGDYQQALVYFSRAVELFTRLGLADAALTAQNNIAQAQISLGRVAEAEATLKDTVRRAEASGDQSSYAHALFLQGLASRDRGRLAEAVTFQQQSLALRETMVDVPAMAESHAELSQLLLHLTRPTEAEAEARRAIGLASEGRLLNTLADAQLHLAHALEAQGRSADAQVEFERAIATTEQLRDQALVGQRSRQAFMRERIGPYAALSALHSKAGRAWEALRTVEQARARTLLDMVAFGRPSSAGLSDTLRERERAVTTELRSAMVSLNEALNRDPVDRAAIAAREEARDRARLAHQIFKDDLDTAYPRLRLSRGDAPTLSKSDLDAIVPRGTVALEFMVNSDHVWVYAAVGSERGVQVTAHRLTMAPSALMALADRFSKQVSSRDLGFADTSRELYAALLSGVDVQVASATRVIIVPDGALWSVPFQALTTPRGRYLIEERAVSYAPSLSSLVALRARAADRPARARTLVALGDPVTSGSAGGDLRNASSGSLPEARREVESLGRLFGDAQSTVLVGASASEAALRKVASRASVLHIASHGVLDNRSPMFSHLRLAGQDTEAPDVDGRLEAWELADLDLSADLVVLSACSTVGGIVGGGEGVIGLSWALLAAGASTAVLSQWEVDSSSTTSLMLAFHTQRLRGDASLDAAPAALRSAALTMLKDPKYRHPFYWAGFIVMGS